LQNSPLISAEKISLKGFRGMLEPKLMKLMLNILSKLTFLLAALLLLPSSLPAQKYWPTIEGLNPLSGPVDMPITITGRHFGDPQPNSTVTFNGTLGKPTTWSDTKIVVPVPEGATTGLLQVTVNGTTKTHGLYYPTFTVVTDSFFLQKIQAGDKDAIADAGQSGDRKFVTYLQQELKNHKPRGANFTGFSPAELALARLGEVPQLQEIWCASITDDPKHGLFPSTFYLELVGGWFAIQGIEKLLTPDDLVHFHKPTKEEINSDALQLPFSVTALMALPKVVPKPPAGATSLEAQFHFQESIKFWQDWIAAHEKELSKLQPTGQSVDFSATACKNGKPRTMH
jgi:hypothetical protein